MYHPWYINSCCFFFLALHIPELIFLPLSMYLHLTIFFLIKQITFTNHWLLFAAKKPCGETSCYYLEECNPKSWFQAATLSCCSFTLTCMGNKSSSVAKGHAHKLHYSFCKYKMLFLCLTTFGLPTVHLQLGGSIGSTYMYIIQPVPGLGTYHSYDHCVHWT